MSLRIRVSEYLKGSPLSLKLRLVLMIIVTLFLGVGILLWKNFKTIENALLSKEKEKIEIFAEVLEKSITAKMLENKGSRLEELLKSLKREGMEIENVSILNTNGLVVKSSIAEEKREKIVDPIVMNQVKKIVYEISRAKVSFPLSDDDKNSHRFIVLHSIAKLDSCKGCHKGNERLRGILLLGVSLDKTFYQINSLKKSIIYSTLATLFILVIAISLGHERWINKPFKTMLQTMEGVKKGNLHLRVKGHFSGEMEVFKEGFNLMIERLEKAKEQQALSHNREMERVDQLASLGELASSLAHEIKNPLAGISGAIQVLSHGSTDAETRKQIMEQIIEETKRIDKTLSDLLSFAKAPKPNPQNCELSTIMERVLLLLTYQLNDQKIKVTYDKGSFLPLIWADPDQFLQVLLNLALNAIQAMPEGGDLKVKIFSYEEKEKNFIRTDLSDTGAGITPDIIEKIFDPFFTTKHRGTGLGLYNSKRIVEDHGGKILVESESGKGATFSILVSVEARQQTNNPIIERI